MPEYVSKKFNLIILFILFIHFSFSSFSMKLITESSGFLDNVSSYRISDNTEFRIFTIKGHFKSNAGEFI